MASSPNTRHLKWKCERVRVRIKAHRLTSNRVQTAERGVNNMVKNAGRQILLWKYQVCLIIRSSTRPPRWEANKSCDWQVLRISLKPVLDKHQLISDIIFQTGFWDYRLERDCFALLIISKKKIFDRFAVFVVSRITQNDMGIKHFEWMSNFLNPGFRNFWRNLYTIK